MQSIKGSKGSWKEFLNTDAKGLRTSISDPARRSIDTLISFIGTFIEKGHLKVSFFFFLIFFSSKL